MAEPRKVKTMQLSGNDYAKVAERLRLFRNTFPHSKTESAYEYEEDKSVVFSVWVWKEKQDLIELMRAGVTDKATLRASADANGSARGQIGTKVKDFEKLETVALGRALAVLGFLASGEIASFEEMEQFEEFRQQQNAEAVKKAIKSLEGAKTMDELKKAFVATRMMENPQVVAAKDKRKAELMKGHPAEQPKAKTTVKTPPAKPTETVEDDKVREPAVPIPKSGDQEQGSLV